MSCTAAIKCTSEMEWILLGLVLSGKACSLTDENHNTCHVDGWVRLGKRRINWVSARLEQLRLKLVGCPRVLPSQ